ncbi:MAG: molybdopterin-dependent oxidoreductase [Acidimicrobiales bacterium]
MPSRSTPTAPSGPLSALAGFAAAACALAVGELPTAIAGQRVGLVAAVANEFVDRFAASLKDLAVALFGQNDKVALVVGVVVASLALGAVLGLVARHRFWIAALGFVAFGAIGFGSLATDPSSGVGWALGSATIAVTTGIGVLAVTLRTSSAATSETSRWGPGDDPTVTAPPRRQFLVVAGMLGAASVTGVAGRVLRGRGSVEAERRALELPDPIRSTPTTASDRTLTQVEGLSPYVTPNEAFYRIDTALGIPQVAADSWRLQVHGLVEAPYELTLEEILDMDLVEETVTIACVSNEVGGDLVGNARWLGVPLGALLERAGVDPEGTQVVGRSTDGFTVGFPTETALDGRIAMVAVGMNGEPLPAAHGYPARLIVAGLYGYVSATKWLSEIELTRFEDFDAYWIPRGWAKEAPIKTQSRIDVPRSGAEVDPGPTAVAGVAWAPTEGIAAVEVQVDDGRWRPAELGEAESGNTWRQWVHRWDATPGTHTVRVRATDAAGDTQTPEERPPRPDGATGYHEIQVRVRA